MNVTASRPSGRWVFIEDEEGEATVGGKRPGRVDVIVLNRDDPAASRPELLKILPTGIGPEGVAIVTSRSDGKKLLITSNESEPRKTLVSDILAEHGLLLEKVESLCLLDGDMWIATDNDGAGWTQAINLGPVRK